LAKKSSPSTDRSSITLVRSQDGAKLLTGGKKLYLMLMKELNSSTQNTSQTLENGIKNNAQPS
jgi:hypothetical protein